MITELLRADNNQLFAVQKSHVSDLWGWITECLQSEFPFWWTQSIDSIEQEDGSELLTIDGVPKAVLRFRAGWDAL